MTDIEDLIEETLEAHVPREIFFGYPVEPGGIVEEGYTETCMCGEKYPCDAVRLVKALEKVTAERDEAWRVAAEQTRTERGRAEKAEAERDEERRRADAYLSDPDFDQEFVKLKAERDQLAAVVHYLRLLTDGSDWNGGQVDDILNSAPPVALDRVKAEALREAADDFETYWTSGAPVKHPPEVWLRRMADRIEKGESNE